MAINKSNEEINKAFELIENGVRSFLDSDNYKKYLSFLSKFHAYSLNNSFTTSECFFGCRVSSMENKFQQTSKQR